MLTLKKVKNLNSLLSIQKNKGNLHLKQINKLFTSANMFDLQVIQSKIDKQSQEFQVI